RLEPMGSIGQLSVGHRGNGVAPALLLETADKLAVPNRRAILFSQNRVSWTTLRSHEGNPGNFAGRRCCVSNDALDRGVSCRGTRFRGLRSASSFRILRSVLAAALQFSSPPRSFLL